MNVLAEHSITQLLYNLIHWALGVILIMMAGAELRLFFKGGRRWQLLGPKLLFTNGALFVTYVLVVITAYTFIFGIDWQVPYEHKIHLMIGTSWIIGAAAEIFYRKGKLKHPVWHSLMSLSLIAGGALFLHPQHAIGDGFIYLTNYHRWLGGFLIASGVAAIAAQLLKSHKILPLASLALIATGGFIFILYRHPLTITADCQQSNRIHVVRVSRTSFEPSHVSATLCDAIKFTSYDGEIHQVAFGEHSHHLDFPGLGDGLLRPDEPLELPLELAGSFRYHNHLNETSRSSITVQPPKEESGWIKTQL